MDKYDSHLHLRLRLHLHRTLHRTLRRTLHRTVCPAHRTACTPHRHAFDRHSSTGWIVSSKLILFAVPGLSLATGNIYADLHTNLHCCGQCSQVLAVRPRRAKRLRTNYRYAFVFRAHSVLEVYMTFPSRVTMSRLVGCLVKCCDSG